MHRLSKIVRVVLIGTTLLCGNFQGLEAVAAEQPKPMLEVEDVLGLPSERTQLKAYLFTLDSEGKRSGVGGESVEFFIQKRSVGKADTASNGIAALDFVPRLRGNLSITARIRESSNIPDLEATGLLAAWEKRRPILLVDLAALLPQTSREKPSLRLEDGSSGQAILPDPDSSARDELEKLGKFYYNLVYLSRESNVSMRAVRDWVRQHQLPTGVPMAISAGAPALIGFIEKLKEDGWENVESGIGRSTEFAEVLVERRIQTVIIQESENDEKFPRRAKIVKGWNKVRRHL